MGNSHWSAGIVITIFQNQNDTSATDILVSSDSESMHFINPPLPETLAVELRANKDLL